MASLRASLVSAWYTNDEANRFLFERLPPGVWEAEIPGVKGRTVRMIAAHLHNIRCRWIRTLGLEHGIAVPARVDHRRVTRRALIAALPRSAKGIAALLELAMDSAGQLPVSRLYTWRNLPLDVGSVLAYFVAHEAHHRGQLIMAARQMGHRLPIAAAAGVWNFTHRAAEHRHRRR